MGSTLIIVGGPTASGKTSAAVRLAQHFATEVISADSRQFYRAMRIGTARPLPEELLGVPHHFLGHLEVEQTWSAGQFAREAEIVLQQVLKEHGVCILVGGSGLYIDALVKGMDPLPVSDPRLRERLQQRLTADGSGSLLRELEQLDPATYATIDRNNGHRVLRALEVCILTGVPYSAQRTSPKDRADLDIIRLAMDLPREQLYARIDERVDRMQAEGLVAEAASLLPYRQFNALRTVGYRELFEHFDGACSLEQAMNAIKQHTRNYAKRQMTWLRRDSDHLWVQPWNTEHMIAVAEARIAHG